MLNFLIVDDEPLIHISIERLIKTCCPEAAVRHAYHGREMLEQLKKETFLMAYVDIKMPGLSGLEALEQAKKIAPFTRYYIMTGFNEFEYAKQAIRLKVDDYLMKPLDAAIIRETITASREYHRQYLEQQKNVFRNWLESTLNQRFSGFQNFSGYYCCLLLVTIDKEPMTPEMIRQPFRHFSEQMVSFFTEDGLFLLAFSPQFDILRGITQTLSTHQYPTGMTCFAGSISNDPAELATTLNTLRKYSCLRAALGLSHFYYLTPLTKRSPQLLEFCRHCISWQNFYRQKNYPLFDSHSEILCNQLEQSPEAARSAANFLVFAGLVLDSKDSLPQEPGELRQRFSLAAAELLSLSPDNKIQAIIRYIQEHYQENLSAADLSECFGLSANYISNLLKQTLGIRYNDYVTQLRLSRAKELLISTQLPIKDITSDCGYFSQSHFTKLFLKYEGCTPAEFRKNQRPSQS